MNSALYVIRCVHHDAHRGDGFVFFWMDCLELEFTKQKAWPFNGRLAREICAECNRRWARVGTFSVEGLPDANPVNSAPNANNSWGHDPRVSEVAGQLGGARGSAAQSAGLAGI